MASAGWLFLLVVLLAAPPSPGPRRGGGPGDGTADGPADGPAGGTVREPGGDEPPAVVSLLAGKLDRTGFGATLAGLAAQGWFQVRPPAPPPGPAMCVVPAEAPGGSLTPFERRVVAHVALRAGAAGQVPAPARRAGGLRRGPDEYRLVQLPRRVAAARDRDEYDGLAARLPRHDRHRPGAGRVLRHGDLAGHERDGRTGQGHDLPGRGGRRGRRAGMAGAPVGTAALRRVRRPGDQAVDGLR